MSRFGGSWLLLSFWALRCNGRDLVNSRLGVRFGGGDMQLLSCGIHACVYAQVHTYMHTSRQMHRNTCSDTHTDDMHLNVLTQERSVSHKHKHLQKRSGPDWDSLAPTPRSPVSATRYFEMSFPLTIRSYSTFLLRHRASCCPLRTRDLRSKETCRACKVVAAKPTITPQTIQSSSPAETRSVALRRLKASMSPSSFAQP